MDNLLAEKKAVSFIIVMSNAMVQTVNEEVSYIKDGDVFDLGGYTIEVIATPGHSLGCVCFLDKERRWLFAGDSCCKAHMLQLGSRREKDFYCLILYFFRGK